MHTLQLFSEIIAIEFAPDRRADLLVLDANPLDDIRNTRRIAALYIAGKEVDRPALKSALLRTGN